MFQPEIRTRIYQHYFAHFLRTVGATDSAEDFDPRKIPRRDFGIWDRTYGPLVHAVASGGEVLDLGCGAGIFLHWLGMYSHIRPVGVDISPSMVAIARRALPQLEIACEDGLSFLQRNPSRFAAVFSLQVFEHLSDDELFAYVDAVFSALRPGGLVCIETPNAANLLGSYARYLDLTHQRVFTPTSLIQLLEIGGFERVSLLQPRPVRWLGFVRVFLEKALHRAVFLICNYPRERVFSAKIAVIGYKPEHGPTAGPAAL